MQKLLNGRELADFIKERQSHQVRALAHGGAKPKLAIIVAADNPVIDVYVRLKKQYGTDLGIAVEVHRVPQADVPALITQLNKDKTVHSVIVQLPLEDPSQTDEIVNAIAPAKDVDALGAQSVFDPATPMSIIWLLAGYNIDLKNKHILLIGRGKLVGAPLAKMLQASALDVEVIGRDVADLKAAVLAADVVITATGQPGLLTADMLKLGAVVVDAGTASESGKTVGDLAADVYERDDIIVTPPKGGVGPLTVCALFENVIKAYQMEQA